LSIGLAIWVPFYRLIGLQVKVDRLIDLHWCMADVDDHGCVMGLLVGDGVVEILFASSYDFY